MPSDIKNSNTKVAVEWSGISSEIVSPIRNTDQKYLKFINTSLFNEEARRYLSNLKKYGKGFYIDAPPLTHEYEEYWDEQTRRCLFGYEVGGVRITGRHYFYLNFCLIRARPFNFQTGKESSGRKIWTFPRFLDHNYYLFHEIEKNFLEGPYQKYRDDLDSPYKRQGMIIAKSRRKGMSFFAAGGLFSYNYHFFKASNNIIAAAEKSHYEALLQGTKAAINGVNKNTSWAKRNIISRMDHIKSGYKYKDDTGMEIESGFLSEIQAVSFKDTAFKSIGQSSDLIAFEEAGMFPNLINAFRITQPTFMDGDIVIGDSVVFGTGGSMEGGTRDFFQMFYNPDAFGLAAYENIYDENATGDCGWFIDDCWYKPGIRKDSDGIIQYQLDSNGNSNREASRLTLLESREQAKKDGKGYDDFVTQYPLTPAEAFLRPHGSILPAKMIQEHLAYVQSRPDEYINKEMRGYCTVDSITGKINFELDMDAPVIHSYPLDKGDNDHGAIVIYEPPQRNEDGDIPFGVYIAGNDPYDQDKSTTDSLGSTLIMNALTGRIVAEYTGRPSTAYYYYENVRKLLIFYNALCLYENNKMGLFQYFEKNKCTHLLADTPRILKDKDIISGIGKGNQSKGVTTSKAINKYGDELIKHWMLDDAYGEENTGIKNLHKIKCIPLLIEAVMYSDDGNYDRISALKMVLILREEMYHFRTKRDDVAIDRSKELKNWFFGNTDNPYIGH